MKLDHDNVRLLLLFAEEKEESSYRNEDELKSFAADNNISEEELVYDIIRLKEAGFIDAKVIYGGNGKPATFRIKAITWNGHEYLDNIRDPEIWKKTKTATSKVSGASLQLVGQIAGKLIWDMIF